MTDDARSAAPVFACDAFKALRKWALEHVDALPDLDELDSDAASIIVALRAMLVGETGCTEEDDYTPEQWRVLMLCKEAARVAA